MPFRGKFPTNPPCSGSGWAGWCWRRCMEGWYTGRDRVRADRRRIWRPGRLRKSSNPLFLGSLGDRQQFLKGGFVLDEFAVAVKKTDEEALAEGVVLFV